MDRQTDRRHALCTVVHRAVMMHQSLTMVLYWRLTAIIFTLTITFTFNEPVTHTHYDNLLPGMIGLAQTLEYHLMQYTAS